MSLALAAKHLESQGRGGDSHLVHMSTGEVNALNELARVHGGQLTINPKTGLVEAGFLSSILPTVAGIALGAVTGDPFIAAALVGGADALITGSLGQGLMAGLGAWSGANLAGDITALAPQVQQGVDTGSAIFNTESARALGQTMNPLNGQPVLGSGDLTSGFASQGTNIAPAFNAAPVPMPQDPQALIPQVNANFTPQAPQSLLGPNATTAAAANATAAAPGPLDFSQNLSKFQPGFDQFTSHPLDSIKQIYNSGTSGKMDLFGTAMPFVSGALKAFQPSPYVPPAAQKNPMHLKYLSSDFQGTNPQGGAPYYTASYTDYTRNPYIPGSVVSSASGGLQQVMDMINPKVQEAPIAVGDPNAKYDPTQYEGVSGISANKWSKDTDSMSSDKLAKHVLNQAKQLGKTASSVMASKSTLGADPAQAAMSSIASGSSEASAKEGGLMGYAAGGLGTLGGYSDGGRLLKGPGDGVSDSIPASIGHRQPARLAEGEFVIPARIVSELGNGSTDAGAKRLYAMMDRIKAKRASTKNIAADTKTYNFLPA
jgi:hypothetical protein